MNKYQEALNKLKMPSSVDMNEDEAIDLLQELVDRLDNLPSALDAFDRILMHKVDLLELAYNFNKELGSTIITLYDIVDNDLSDTIKTIDKALDWSEDE